MESDRSAHEQSPSGAEVDSGGERPDGRQPADAAAVDVSDALPPLTDRGVGMTPVGHVDYLKATVWADALDVMDYLRRDFVERFSSASDWEWGNRGVAKRIRARWQFGALEVFVLEYADGGGFVSVELKGLACLHFRDKALATLLADLTARWQTRLSRVDYAWDGVPFGVLTVKSAIDAGNVNSKCRLPELTDYHQDPRTKGRTVYFPRFGADRFMRVYDKRGPVRLELQHGKDYAAYVGSKLVNEPVSTWPVLMMGWLRHLVDFVDRSSGNRADRCPLLDWWAKFVNGVSKLPAISHQLEPDRHVLGRVELGIQRSARIIEAVRRAFGEERREQFRSWFEDRIKHYAERTWSDRDEQNVRQLRAWRSSKVIGWTPDGVNDEPVPF